MIFWMLVKADEEELPVCLSIYYKFIISWNTIIYSSKIKKMHPTIGNSHAGTKHLERMAVALIGPQP